MEKTEDTVFLLHGDSPRRHGDSRRVGRGESGGLGVFFNAKYTKNSQRSQGVIVISVSRLSAANILLAVRDDNCTL